MGLDTKKIVDRLVVDLIRLKELGDLTSLALLERVSRELFSREVKRLSTDRGLCPGARVCFEDRHGVRVEGTVIRLGRKRATVTQPIPDGERCWTVSLWLLEVLS